MLSSFTMDMQCNKAHTYKKKLACAEQISWQLTVRWGIFH